MSRPEVVLCADDKPIIVDLSVIADACPPVLRRFLGMSDSSESVGCFKEAARDEQGRLTFAKHLGITRSGFQACITFIKTGYVSSIDMLVSTMDILGGCARLDAYVVKKQAEQEVFEAYQLEKELTERKNPTTPAADMGNLYIWRAQQCSWTQGQSEEWSVTNKVESSSVHYWWRKRRETVEEMDEEL